MRWRSIRVVTLIRVLDSSSLIKIKIAVRLNDQWGLFKHLEALFLRGEVTFPVEVEAEMRSVRHPDAPGVWVCGVARQRRDRQAAEPHEDYIAHVMDEAPDVVDPRKLHRDGDPYVLAQALELRAGRLEVAVVTEDRKDKADHCAMTTACERLSLPEMTLQEFLDGLDWVPGDASLPH